MIIWQKRYHELYQHLKAEFDPHVIQWITDKEDIVVNSPYSFPMLRHGLAGIRRFKSSKLRLLYTLSTEKLDNWSTIPDNPEIMFLYLDLRDDETYKEALKLLQKHGVV